MKKMMFAAVAALAMVGAANATLSAQIKTAAPGAPKIASTESVAGYKCYTLSGTKMASAMGIKSIGATEVDRVAEWLGADFDANYEEIQKTKPISMNKTFSNQSLDLSNTDSSLSYANRFGILTWENDVDDIAAFRVFNFNGSDTINDWAGTSTSGAWSDWQSVPEPTSAMLLLLGVAGLALKRRRT